MTPRRDDPNLQMWFLGNEIGHGQCRGGRLLAVVIMVVGVSLFLRLLQSIFRPNKVRFECPDCGLMVHDPDAVHCKACGKMLKIPNEDLD